jgi:uncharacterized protein YbaP (TraB family)
MNLLKNLFIFALGLMSLTAFAQNENSLLYKISGNGITKPSYIFGTIHITCDATLDEATKKALDATTQMYLELDMDDPELQSKMMNSVSMKNGMTISSMISAEDYKILDDYLLQKMKVSAAVFNTYKPFILSSMFLSTLLDCSPESFESNLVKASISQKEPIFGLETVEYQMAIFDQIPYQLQAEELIRSIKNDFRDDKTELNLLLKTYAMKDLNEMSRLSSSSKSAIMSNYEDVLLNNRNSNWINTIKQVAKEHPTFFGVGAAHLVGEKGLVSLLRRDGYLVEAL